MNIYTGFILFYLYASGEQRFYERNRDSYEKKQLAAIADIIFFLLIIIIIDRRKSDVLMPQKFILLICSANYNTFIRRVND